MWRKDRPQNHVEEIVYIRREAKITLQMDGGFTGYCTQQVEECLPGVETIGHYPSYLLHRYLQSCAIGVLTKSCQKWLGSRLWPAVS